MHLLRGGLPRRPDSLSASRGTREARQEAPVICYLADADVHDSVVLARFDQAHDIREELGVARDDVVESATSRESTFSSGWRTPAASSKPGDLTPEFSTGEE